MSPSEGFPRAQCNQQGTQQSGGAAGPGGPAAPARAASDHPAAGRYFYGAAVARQELPAMDFLTAFEEGRATGREEAIERAAAEYGSSGLIAELIPVAGEPHTYTGRVEALADLAKTKASEPVFDDGRMTTDQLELEERERRQAEHAATAPAADRLALDKGNDNRRDGKTVRQQYQQRIAELEAEVVDLKGQVAALVGSLGELFKAAESARAILAKAIGS